MFLAPIVAKGLVSVILCMGSIIPDDLKKSVGDLKGFTTWTVPDGCQATLEGNERLTVFCENGEMFSLPATQCSVSTMWPKEVVTKAKVKKKG